MFYPLVSVIVPVYKVENYIENCVFSIINQTYNNLEIILIDDGSPDNSGVLCDELALLDSRIQVIHKSNGGLSSARNAGIDIAKGEYLMFVDSDDELGTADTISQNIIFFDGKVDIIQFPIIKFDKNNHILQTLCYTKGYINDETTFKKHLLPRYKTNIIDNSACNKIYHHQIFKEYKFRPNIIHEDAVFQADICTKFHNIALNDSGYYKYYVRGESINTSRHTLKWISDYINMLIIYYNISKETKGLFTIAMNNYCSIIDAFCSFSQELTVAERFQVVQSVINSMPSWFDILHFMIFLPKKGFKLLLSKAFNFQLRYL